MIRFPSGRCADVYIDRRSAEVAIAPQAKGIAYDETEV
jgi:hypothetical protein